MGTRLRLRLGILLAAVLGSACVASAQTRSANNATVWSERGVFVFGAMVFDIRSGHFRAGPFVDRIEDCSNDEFYCLRTRDFELALPRACRRIAVGDVWRVGGVETHVLYHDTSRVPPVTYLGNPARRSVVYRYGFTSVGSIYWDSSGETDLVAMAAAGSLSEWMGSPNPRWARMHHSLITFDAFGECR